MTDLPRAILGGTPAALATQLRDAADRETSRREGRFATADELREVAAALDATRSELLALIGEMP